MNRIKIFFLSFILLFFAVTSLITYKVTNKFSLKKEDLLEFEDFYLEKNFLKGDLEIVHQAENTETATEIEYIVNYGDTLESIFSQFEFASVDYKKVINLLHENVKGMKIYAGQKLNISYKTIINYSPLEETEEAIMPNLETKNQKNIFTSIFFQTNEGTVEIFKDEQNSFQIKIVPFQKLAKTVFKSVIIKNSLYQDGVEAGISPTVLENLIRLYSFDVDFQRDIREGDKFEVYFEEIIDENTGKKLRDGNIIFSKITLEKSASKAFEYYLFKGEYYDDQGKTSQKSFLKTPVPGARLSSRFGLRRHPILGFTRLHSGIDFAAPRGTPIFAAANGTIQFIGWNGGPKTGYGKLIIIKHNSTYSTAYAHMNGFRKGLKSGSKVRQGEVIGYVGSTGYSTGPHLHYEIIKNGAKINPNTVVQFATKALPVKEIEEFKLEKAKIIQKVQELKK